MHRVQWIAPFLADIENAMPLAGSEVLDYGCGAGVTVVEL